MGWPGYFRQLREGIRCGLCWIRDLLPLCPCLPVDSPPRWPDSGDPRWSRGASQRRYLNGSAGQTLLALGGIFERIALAPRWFQALPVRPGVGIGVGQ